MAEITAVRMRPRWIAWAYQGDQSGTALPTLLPVIPYCAGIVPEPSQKLQFNAATAVALPRGV